MHDLKTISSVRGAFRKFEQRIMVKKVESIPANSSGGQGERKTDPLHPLEMTSYSGRAYYPVRRRRKEARGIGLV